MQTLSLEQKRELRRKETSEVFTPIKQAQDMIDKIPETVWEDPSKTLLEPSCGDGIFVCLSIKKRLSLGVSIEDAIKNTYAIDIMGDNIRECHLNVFAIILDYFRTRFENGQLNREETRSQTQLCTAILFHNVRTTKDTLAENFDKWKTFDELSSRVKFSFMARAKRMIPKMIKRLESREAPKQTKPTVIVKPTTNQKPQQTLQSVVKIEARGGLTKARPKVRREPVHSTARPKQKAQPKPFVSQETLF